MPSGPEIKEKAFAKVNLTLEIRGKRRDGYHNLISIMQTVDLFDEVNIYRADDLRVRCDDLNIPAESNLAIRAARLLRDQAGVNDGAYIEINKNIPVSAGLGGGSSDASAVLRGLNKLWDLRLSLSELTGLAAEVGSDEPFLVRGGTSLIQGRGETVTPLPSAKVNQLLILSPLFKNSTAIQKTKTVFSGVTPSLFTRGDLTHKLAARIRGGGDVPAEFFFNQFGSIAETIFPGWETHRNQMLSFGAREVILCGAGPAMFTVPPTKELGTTWHLLLTSVHKKRAYLVKPTPAVPESR